jgi:hypothetical protein
MIGLFAFALPLVVFFGNWLFFTHHVAACLFPSSNLPGSLSGFYYTHMRSVFVGVLWAMGVFLAAYNGYDNWDRWITNIAGLSAIALSCFPTKPPGDSTSLQASKCGPVTPVSYVSSSHQAIIGYVHVGCTITLFIMVAVMAVVFTRSDKDRVAPGRIRDSREDSAGSSEAEQAAGHIADSGGTVAGGTGSGYGELLMRLRGNDPKARRNRVYVTCAILIALSGLWALVSNWAPWKDVTPWLLWCETVAFFSFGIAWLVKSQTLVPKGLRS